MITLLCFAYLLFGGLLAVGACWLAINGYRLIETRF